MRRLLAIGLAATLAACATTAQVDTGKALAGAWAALDAASITADVAVKTGRLHGSAAAQVAHDLRTAAAALQVATNAYRGLDTTHDASSQILIAAAAIAEITLLAGGRP